MRARGDYRRKDAPRIPEVQMTTVTAEQQGFTYARRWLSSLLDEMGPDLGTGLLDEARTLLRIAGMIDTHRDLPDEVVVNALVYLATERQEDPKRMKAWVVRNCGGDPIRAVPPHGDPDTWDQQYLDRIDRAVGTGSLGRDRCPDCGECLLWAVDPAAGRAVPLDPEPRLYSEGGRYVLEPEEGAVHHYLKRYPPKPADVYLFRSHLTRCEAPSIAR